VNKKKTYILAFSLLTIFFILPYMGVIFYTLPRNDEFAGAFNIAYYGGSYSLSTLIRSVTANYMTWEGNYSGVFFYTMLNPIVIGNTDFAIYAMNIICFTAYIVAMLFILHKLLCLFNMDIWNNKLLSLLTLIMCMNCRFMRETLGWFTGYMYYTFQFLTGSLGILLAIKLTYRPSEKKWKNAFGAVVIVLLQCIAAGGTLQITAIMCWCSLLFLIWTIYNKDSKIYSITLFASALAFALVNVCAPGHKVRSGDYEEISLIKGLIYGAICVFKELRHLCTETWFPYAMFLIFVALFFVIKPRKARLLLNPIIVLLAGLGCIYISTFPVCYGYASSEMASRGYETMDMLIIISSVLFLGSIVNTLMLHNITPTKESLLTLSMVFCLILSTVGLSRIEISDIPIVQCISGLASGEIQDYSNYWRNVLNIVRNTDETEVIIPVDKEYLEKECIIDRVMFQTDETNWANNAAAIYYNKSYIKLVIE